MQGIHLGSIQAGLLLNAFVQYVPMVSCLHSAIDGDESWKTSIGSQLDLVKGGSVGWIEEIKPVMLTPRGDQRMFARMKFTAVAIVLCRDGSLGCMYECLDAAYFICSRWQVYAEAGRPETRKLMLEYG